MRRLAEQLGIILLICVGLRVGAALIEPVLPVLGGILVAAVLAVWLLGRNGPGGGYR